MRALDSAGKVLSQSREVMIGLAPERLLIGKVAVGDDGPIPGQAPVEPILIKKISLLK